VGSDMSPMRAGGGPASDGSAEEEEDPRSDWRERHAEKMFPTAAWVDICGGLAGGEARSADCSRVRGGCCCDESQEKADGNNILSEVMRQRYRLCSGWHRMGRVSRRALLGFCAYS